MVNPSYSDSKYNMEILFFQEDVNFPWNYEEVVRSWIEETIHLEKETVEIGEISIVFCSDEYLLDINSRYLDHDYYTDIVTFPFSDDPLSADLYISTDRVHENSRLRSIGFVNELNRIMIHGILHLCGHQDKTDPQKLKMRELEDLYLAGLPPLDDVKYK